ncbi:serine/threonine-protein kinase [Friedmanniella endophytica]|uniref:Serine/threonine-protein kinase n=1 Tax=Microlunatus kandeliicorticis TaxID=1759536 RepID=A0A7W3IV09_9ACTN|nr:hypothetical protein [Microlunatus kandeliicorticis]MBA8795788.1 serine/threonine-protein kinase [Microlunatus kandeliicorticis]
MSEPIPGPDEFRAAVHAGAFDPSRAFVRFANETSGALAFGVEHAGRRWFVKGRGPGTPSPTLAASLARAAALHAAVRHPVVVPLVGVLDGLDGPTLVYPWCDGEVLSPQAEGGPSALDRFRRLPVATVTAAVGDLLDAHRVIAAAGWIAGDLYDSCFLWDAAARRIRLIDLDEYRPGPFVLDSERLYGSSRYLAPEESVRGALIDQRSTVVTLGRTVQQLLASPDGGWRGSTAQAAMAERACADAPEDRYPTVSALVAAWAGVSTADGPSQAGRRGP